MKVISIIASCAVTLQLVFALPQNSHQTSSVRIQGAANLASVNGSESEGSSPQMGSAEWLSTGGPSGNVYPWPRRKWTKEIGKGDLTIIPYCFVDQRSHDKLSCKVKGAIRLWSDAIGKYGPENQHSLAFHPPSNRPRTQNFNPYCCTSYTYGEENKELDAMTDLKCVWNTAKYPTDTLTIHWVDEVKANNQVEATLGYYPDVPNEESVPGRHSILITEGAGPLSIAHEIGHVLGMAHEFQRWDRDEYVQFKCENLRGMKEIVHDAYEKNGKPNGKTEIDMWESLCENARDAASWEAPSTAWIKGDGLPEGSTLDGPDGFDYDSITMYESAAGANVPYYDLVTVDTATLVKVKKDPTTGRTYVDPKDWRINPPVRVSGKDAAFVRRFYPWGSPWIPSGDRPSRPSGPDKSPPRVEDPPSPPRNPPPVPPRPSRSPPKPSRNAPPPVPRRPS